MKVLAKVKYAVGEKKWKITCSGIKIVKSLNEIIFHNLDVIRCYKDRIDGFVSKINFPFNKNPLLLQRNSLKVLEIQKEIKNGDKSKNNIIVEKSSSEDSSICESIKNLV